MIIDKYIKSSIHSLLILVLIIMIFIGTIFAEIDCFYDTILAGKWNILYGIIALILICVILNTKSLPIDFILLLCYGVSIRLMGVDDVSLKVVSIFVLFKAFKGMAKETIKTLYWLIPIIISVLSILGIIQFFEDYYFDVSVCFDNPVGFAVSNVCGFVCALYSYKINIGYKKAISILCIFLTFIGIVISGSRSALLVSIVTTALFFNLKNLFFRQKIWIRVVIIFLIISVLCAFFYIKIDSSYGRILIWRCCFEMICDNPILGIGHDGFVKSYMLYQGQYFSHNNDSIFTQFADNVLFPFNEYLTILINYGLWGLLIMIGFCSFIFKIYSRNKDVYTRCAFTGIVAIAIFSLFSYPFRYPFTWVFVVLCVSVILQSIKIEWDIKNNFFRQSVKICLLVFSIFILLNLYRNINSEMKWLKLSDSLTFDSSINVSHNYVEIFDELQNNQYFLYDYAVKMYEIDSYNKSLQIVSILKQFRNSYDIEILQAQNYFKLKNYDNAIVHFGIASNMIPNRIIPKYGIFLSHKERGDFVTANKLARSILLFRPKVQNETVHQIKTECEKYLNENTNYE